MLAEASLEPEPESGRLSLARGAVSGSRAGVL